jgi:hypothetical protein
MTPFKTADKFREAVRFGNFRAADRLLGELRGEVERSWAAAPAEERQSIAVEVLELLDWARQAAMVTRSHAQRKLTQVRRGGAYVPVASRGHLEFEG